MDNLSLPLETVLVSVVLRHTMPDGSHHFDWMVDRTPRQDGNAGSVDERCLVTFRMPERLDVAAQGDSAVSLVRIHDHRRRYLACEGPLDGGRGSVQRVLEGVARLSAIESGRWFVIVHLSDTRNFEHPEAMEFELRYTSDDSWLLIPSADGQILA